MSSINNQGGGLGPMNALWPPHHTTALLSSKCCHLVPEPVLVWLTDHGRSREESDRRVSHKEQALARDDPVSAVPSAPQTNTWLAEKRIRWRALIQNPKQAAMA